MAKLHAPMNGTFVLGGDHVAFGSLLLAGKRSRLTLFADREFSPIPEGYRYLVGELQDGDSVTLIDCVLESINNRRMASGQVKSSAHIFPNTIIIGPQHVPPRGKCVSQITVSIKDARSVFYDFDAFSMVLRPEPFISLLKQDKARIRSVEIGDSPIIGYFSGRYEIAKFSSSFGNFSARHRISYGMGGPAGWRIHSQVAISLGFDEPLAFEAAMVRIHALIRFFELIIGRRQVLKGVEIRLHGQELVERSLRVLESHAPQSKADRGLEKNSPGPRDVLLCTTEGVEEFCEVAKNYFESDDVRLDSRVRLGGNIRRNLYNIDRLVTAANMFDIFPKSCYPSASTLSDEVVKARDDARAKFRLLPPSIERDSILNALGRMDDMTLKRKVLARLKSSGVLSNFPGLDEVLKEAVNCRNHYVHGSPGKIDYVRNSRMTIFLTNALEFVFGVSDLVDCGWSFDRWAGGHPQWDHPFGAFRLSYRENYKEFSELMAVGSSSL